MFWPASPSVGKPHVAFRGPLEFCTNFFDLRPYGGLESEGNIYPSLEHAFQAQKTLYVEFRKLIQQAETPGRAKRLGHDVPLREDWEEIKLDVMERLLRKKFAIPELRELLLATGSKSLVEENVWHDDYWGSCTCATHYNKPGQNHLGLLLMKIRGEIFNELNPQKELFIENK